MEVLRAPSLAALACVSVVLCALWDRTLAGMLRGAVAGRAVTEPPEGAAGDRPRGRAAGEAGEAAAAEAAGRTTGEEAASAGAPRVPEDEDARARAPAWLVLDAAGPQVAAHLGVLDAWRARAACRRFAAFFQQAPRDAIRRPVGQPTCDPSAALGGPRSMSMNLTIRDHRHECSIVTCKRKHCKEEDTDFSGLHDLKGGWSPNKVEGQPTDGQTKPCH
ncbi:unnamed protein product [Prorocentrum cordatum]|uniref:Uncharacterized protein n=1 Tax=Prorocentrum cordatum TaxID=2364126 RepID=A0ABN9WSC4_9DINO|nr:unnamed protein product [Polarella glacialis]